MSRRRRRNCWLKEMVSGSCHLMGLNPREVVPHTRHNQTPHLVLVALLTEKTQPSRVQLRTCPIQAKLHTHSKHQLCQTQPVPSQCANFLLQSCLPTPPNADTTSPICLFSGPNLPTHPYKPRYYYPKLLIVCSENASFHSNPSQLQTCPPLNPAVTTQIYPFSAPNLHTPPNPATTTPICSVPTPNLSTHPSELSHYHHKLPSACSKPDPPPFQTLPLPP